MININRAAVTKKDVLIKGGRVYLRRVQPSDIGPKYLSWLTTPEINQYLERRFETHNLDSLHDFVSAMLLSKDSLFLAIVVADGDVHIGNIKLGPVNFNHGYAEMGILVGEKNYWGKGLATDAIRALSDYGFKEIGLNRVYAGAYANNMGSVRAFEKAGFRRDGVLRRQWLSHGTFVDGILMGKLSSD